MKNMPAEWSRGPQWRTEAARLAWGPALAAAGDAWQQLEVLSVSEAMRSSALISVSPEDLPTLSRAAAAQNLLVTPLCFGRVAVHRPGLVNAWHRAYAASDSAEMGRMLGYPACCVEHFMATWAIGKTETIQTQRTAQGPSGTNLMLRWLGVRLVPHLPCSADCEASVEVACQFSLLATKHGLVEERDAIVDLLSLPARYSALHGVGVVTTPHFRIMFGTDYTPIEVSVTREGDPDLAPPTFSWTDNGFATRAAMEAAHAVVLDAVGEAMSALDLGAGDGTLLARIAARAGLSSRAPASVRPEDWTGVECDPGRASRGQGRHPGIRLLEGKIEEGPGEVIRDSPFDVVLLCPARLVEMGPEAAARTLECLVRPSRLVVYSYADNGPLPDLVAKAGLVGKLGVVTAGRGAQAAEFTLEGC